MDARMPQLYRKLCRDNRKKSDRLRNAASLPKAGKQSQTFLQTQLENLRSRLTNFKNAAVELIMFCLLLDSLS